MTHPDGSYFVYGYDGLDRLKSIQQSGTTTIVSETYDPNKGSVATLVRGAVTTTYGYDAILRLTSTTDDLAGTANDETTTLSYNPADQIITETHSNDAYAYSNYVNLNYSYGRNGLNQYTAVGSTAYGYDANGNLTSDGSSTYTYDVENRLLTATGAANATLTYDPLGRLYQTTGATGTTRFLYDGDELVEEYNTSGTVLRRYIHGNEEDDPLIWYEGAGLTDRRSLQDDHQGSIISFADASGNLLHIDSYDDYGVPNGTTTDLSGGRFSFTGQAWLPDLGMYYYKARIYSPSLGRFMQTDPVGYEDQVNLYAYVANDPVNHDDPTGEESGSITCMNDACGQGSFKLSWNTVANVVDAVTLGAAAVETIATAGASALGPDEVEVGVERAATSTLRQAEKTDFVVTPKGTTIPKSQSAMEAGFKRAGIEGRDLAGKGRQYELQGGTRVRAMEPQANGAGRRAPFENSRGQPVSPDGKPVQPPRGTQNTQHYVRERTHIAQDD